MSVIRQRVSTDTVSPEFATDTEVQTAIQQHLTSYTHLPVTASESDYGKFLYAKSDGYAWGDPTPLGWKDNIAPLNVSKGGLPENTPLWINTGNGIWGHMFSDHKTAYAYCDFHINHDYKPNSLIYPHVHWMPLSASTGTVNWKIEYVVAKGHQQNQTLIANLTTINIKANAKGLIGEHMVSETSDAYAFSVSEPDVIVRIRLSRDGLSSDDTFYGGVIGLMVDFHYQSEYETTLNKSPNFFGA